MSPSDSPTGRPPSGRCGAATSAPAWASRVARAFCACVPSPLPRRVARSATVEDPGAAAFPSLRQGRHSRLLLFEACSRFTFVGPTSLPALPRRTVVRAARPCPLPAHGPPVATEVYRQLLRRDFHPREHAAFARRTAELAEFSRAVSSGLTVSLTDVSGRHGAPVDEARAGVRCRERERDGMRQGAIRIFSGMNADRSTVCAAHRNRPCAPPDARVGEPSPPPRSWCAARTQKASPRRDVRGEACCLVHQYTSMVSKPTPPMAERNTPS